jgi:hypothetical protein
MPLKELAAARTVDSEGTLIEGYIERATAAKRARMPFRATIDALFEDIL